MKAIKILICLFMLSLCTTYTDAATVTVKGSATTITNPQKKSKKKSPKKKSSKKKSSKNKTATKLRCECGGDGYDCAYPGKKIYCSGGGYIIACDKCKDGCKCDCTDCVNSRNGY